MEQNTKSVTSVNDQDSPGAHEARIAPNCDSQSSINAEAFAAQIVRRENLRKKLQELDTKLEAQKFTTDLSYAKLALLEKLFSEILEGQDQDAEFRYLATKFMKAQHFADAMSACLEVDDMEGFNRLFEEFKGPSNSSQVTDMVEYIVALCSPPGEKAEIVDKQGARKVLEEARKHLEDYGQWRKDQPSTK